MADDTERSLPDLQERLKASANRKGDANGGLLLREAAARIEELEADLLAVSEAAGLKLGSMASKPISDLVVVGLEGVALKEADVLALAGENYAAKLIKDLVARIWCLEAALRECGAPFVSEPGTVMQTAGMISREFVRRQQLAADAVLGAKGDLGA